MEKFKDVLMWTILGTMALILIGALVALIYMSKGWLLLWIVFTAGFSWSMFRLFNRGNQ